MGTITAKALGRPLYYKVVEPRLVKKTPNRPLYLGMHCKGFETFKYIEEGSLPLNLVELKPDYFRDGDNLFYYRAGTDRFHRHQRNFGRLVAKAKRLGLAMQYHFPDALSGVGLNPGVLGHHNRIVSLFEVVVETINEHGLLPNVTFHLPTLRWGDKVFLPEGQEDIREALENTNRLLLRLSEKHAAEGWPIQLGIENQSRPTKVSHALGCEMGHFENAMRGTPAWVNLTIDAGHRIISDLSLERDLLPFAKQRGRKVRVIHFHENQGEQSDTSHGDQHLLPLGAKVYGYLNYIRRAVQERIPIILEVKTSPYRPIEVLVISRAVRGFMDDMEEERLLLAA